MAHQANGHNYQFYGVDKKKAKRRSNAGKGVLHDRLYYPYATKEQRGTPMETQINNEYDNYIQQFNAMQSHPKGMKMSPSDAVGRLAQTWDAAYKGGKAASKMVKQNGGTIRSALETLGKIAEVHFGADPKSK